MSNSRFAFCIIAHNEPEIFRILVAQIDHPDNDIFVLIDKKSDIKQFNSVSTIYSRITFCENRINIKWGELSQIKAELELFAYATANGDYQHYHLLSGQDLLLKPVQQINKFMRENHDKEFIGLREERAGLESVDFRLRYYHFFTHLCQSKYRIVQLIYFIPVKIQKLIGFRRQKVNNIIMGSNWCSLTQECVKYILYNRDKVLHKFRLCTCSDELYKQYLILNSTFRKQIFKNIDSFNGTDCLRKIDWVRGQPYTWTDKDFEELISSDAFFARKFSARNRSLLKQIYNYTDSLKEYE